jgi:hypothetical protein
VDALAVFLQRLRFKITVANDDQQFVKSHLFPDISSRERWQLGGIVFLCWHGSALTKVEPFSITYMGACPVRCSWKTLLNTLLL